LSNNVLAAAILVGGQSRRMGQDKALMTLTPRGPTIVEMVVRAVQAVTEEVVLVGTDSAGYAFPGLHRVADTFPGTGALGGIHSALASAGSPHVLVVACDMPFLNAGLLRSMASRPRDYEVLVPNLDRLHPLHAIYAQTCLPMIEQCLRAGRYKVTGWFEDARVRTIEREEMERYDPSLLSCFNLNTPEDYAFAKRMLARSPGEADLPAPPASDSG
jgi:molybdopterin-guanine dinucleotide biosynthesis protein A